MSQFVAVQFEAMCLTTVVGYFYCEGLRTCSTGDVQLHQTYSVLGDTDSLLGIILGFMGVL